MRVVNSGYMLIYIFHTGDKGATFAGVVAHVLARLDQSNDSIINRLQ
jgi:hypothetical protein